MRIKLEKNEPQRGERKNNHEQHKPSRTEETAKPPLVFFVG
jgi:hypothetical protein